MVGGLRACTSTYQTHALRLETVVATVLLWSYHNNESFFCWLLVWRMIYSFIHKQTHTYAYIICGAGRFGNESELIQNNPEKRHEVILKTIILINNLIPNLNPLFEYLENGLRIWRN